MHLNYVRRVAIQGLLNDWRDSRSAYLAAAAGPRIERPPAVRFETAYIFGSVVISRIMPLAPSTFPEDFAMPVARSTV